MRRRRTPSGAARAISFTLATIVFLVPTLQTQAAQNGLVQAARGDRLGQVRDLIDSGAEIDTRSGDGSTALLWAVYHGNTDMVQALLAAGADPNVANRYGMSPLLQASGLGNAGIIERLLDAGADPGMTHPDGATPLMLAARTGRVDAVDLLLAHGADPNGVDDYQSQSALMWAAEEGQAAVVQRLLDAGADPNLQARVSNLTDRSVNADFPTGGLSALMWAVRNGHRDVVDVLAAGGADLNLTNGDGATAMMIAIVNDRFDLAAHLLDLGADANDGSLYEAVEMRDATTDWFAHDGSHLRADHDNELTALDLVAKLLDAGADPNKYFKGQMHSTSMCCDTTANATPFYRAAVASDVEALKLLVAHGADLAWTPPAAQGRGGGMGGGAGGQPALFAAMSGGRGVSPSGGPGDLREGPPPFREVSNREPAAAVAVLLEGGADPNTTNGNGVTALQQAAQSRDLEMIRALAEAGATLDALNNDGLTALDVAEGRRGAGAAGGGRRGGPPFGFGGARNADGPTNEDVAALLRELMQAAGVAIVEHGETPAARAAGRPDPDA